MFIAVVIASLLFNRTNCLCNVQSTAKASSLRNVFRLSHDLSAASTDIEMPVGNNLNGLSNVDFKVVHSAILSVNER